MFQIQLVSSHFKLFCSTNPPPQVLFRFIRTIIYMFSDRNPNTFNTIFLHSICMVIGCKPALVDFHLKNLNGACMHEKICVHFS